MPPPPIVGLLLSRMALSIWRGSAIAMVPPLTLFSILNRSILSMFSPKMRPPPYRGTGSMYECYVVIRVKVGSPLFVCMNIQVHVHPYLLFSDQAAATIEQEKYQNFPSGGRIEGSREIEKNGCTYPLQHYI